MRVGQNPNKSAMAENIAPVVLAVLTHLPNKNAAYHSQRMEVMQNCLLTMRENCNTDHTFLVWDNGSMPEFQNWVRYEFKPDMFVNSPNIGKTLARSAMFRIFPFKTVVAYSDDDMLFYPDWLRPQVELLTEFPNVASVTGYPVRTAFRWGIENTLKWARENGKLEVGRFIPQKWEDDFAESVGRTPEWQKEYTKNDIDYRVTYNGKQAYCTSHHCQFIGYAGTIGRILQNEGLAMAAERPFDEMLDRIGLRLATTQRLARHMGNVLDKKLQSEIMQFA